MSTLAIGEGWVKPEPWQIERALVAPRWRKYHDHLRALYMFWGHGSEDPTATTGISQVWDYSPGANHLDDPMVSSPDFYGYVAGPRGIMARMDEAGDAASIERATLNGPVIDFNRPGTLLWMGQCDEFGGGRAILDYSDGVSGSGSSFRTDGTPNMIHVARDTSDIDVWNVSASITASEINVWAITWPVSGTVRLYKDGDEVTTATRSGTVAPITRLSVNSLFGGGSLRGNARHGLIGVWQREFSGGMVAEISARPFAPWTMAMQEFRIVAAAAADDPVPRNRRLQRREPPPARARYAA